jgi:ribosomal protein L11 methyltransferase
LSLHANPAWFDAVSNFLIERGAPGVVIENKELQAYFPRSAGDRMLKEAVQRFVEGLDSVFPASGSTSEPTLRWSVFRNRNWHSAWRRFFTAQKVGKSFWVKPPWARSVAIGKRQVITIDPGMAFGTGTHETTRCCLELIETATGAIHGSEFSSLDVGTGSGILAIALAKLGAKEVWALDNDPVALKAARKNLRVNNVGGIVHLSGATLDRMKRSFSLVVANLTAETILALGEALAKRVAPGGFLILSGILKARSGQVTRCFIGRGFRKIQRKSENEWVTLLFRRGVKDAKILSAAR